MIDNRYYYRAQRISSIQYAIIKAISTLTQLNEFLNQDPSIQPVIMCYIDNLAGCSDSPTLDSHADGKQQCQALFNVSSGLLNLCDEHNISSEELRRYVTGASGTISTLWGVVNDYVRIDDAASQIDWGVARDALRDTISAFKHPETARRMLWLYTIDLIMQLLPGKGNPGTDLKAKFKNYMVAIPDYDYAAVRETLRGMLPFTEQEFRMYPLNSFIAESRALSQDMVREIQKRDGESDAKA